jgi:glutaminyl-peptide cyclotransferase
MGKIKMRQRLITKKWTMRIATLFILPLIILTQSNCTPKNQNIFNEARSFQDIEYQLSLGPRTIGSMAHDQLVLWASSELNSAGWAVQLQQFEWSGSKLSNIIAKRNSGHPWVILGAHYDSRFIADQEPEDNGQLSPVPGANDGASGVAVLLEIARVIPPDLDKNIWIVLFDAEDNGEIPGWEWILGSRVFAANLVELPDSVVIVDMIGDSDLNIYKELSSNTQLVDQIWGIAEELGYPQFIPEYKYQIIDDHLPFLEAGIPAVDIIDFEYPYWHTTQDTIDKVSPESLDVVGEVLLAWLLK